MAAFAELGLCPQIIRSVEEDLGWLLPTPVQQEALRELGMHGGAALTDLWVPSDEMSVGALDEDNAFSVVVMPDGRIVSGRNLAHLHTDEC